MLKFTGLFVMAIVISLIFSFLALGIINNLPRMGQGDHVIIPWELCFVGMCFFQILVPWVTSLIFLHNPKLRIYFLIWLVISFIIVNWLFGGFIAFDKAWRRGL